MWIFTKPVQEIRGEDLQALITGRVRESIALEFKREMYGRRDADTREMLRDVSALGNADGGALIIGMEENRDGVATRLHSVPDAENQARRLVDSCTANIAERIPGLKGVPVSIPGGDVIVVGIPRSYRRPHMITFQGATDFWVRHDRQKSRMSIGEIRTAIVATEELGMKVERFVEQRYQGLTQGRPQLIFALMGTPLLLEEGRVDISDARLATVLRNPPAVRAVGGAVRLAYPEAQVMPTVRGLAAIEPDRQTLEIFRSGHVEFTMYEAARRRLADIPENRRIHSWAVAEYVANFVRLVDMLRELAGIADPYVINLSLWDWHRFTMPERTVGMFGLGAVGEWTEGPNILLPPVLHSLDDGPDDTAKQLLDRLWNAFHFMQCPFFDPAGGFLIPERG